MKKIYLLINSKRSELASAFIKEFSKKDIPISGVVYLKLNIFTRFFHKLREKPFFVYDVVIQIVNQIVTQWGDLITLEQILSSWAYRGENSPDLLEQGIDLCLYAKNNSIPFYNISNLHPKSLINITNGQPSLFAFYGGGILTHKTLDTENIEFVNSHLGAMPRYRGMNGLEWAFLEGNSTEISVMIVNAAIDGGDVIFRMPINTSTVNNIAELRKAGYLASVKAMANSIALYAQAKINKQKQPKGARYYYRMHDQIRTLVQSKLTSSIENRFDIM